MSPARPLSPPPIHLLAGGRWSHRRTPDPLLAGCMALAGVPSPAVAYIGAASDDDAGFFQHLASAFREAGAGRVELVPLAADTSETAIARRRLASADLVFMSGGDVEAGMRCLRRHALVPFLRQMHRSGKPFFGLSAGSIMLASCWVRWTDPDDEGSATAFRCAGLAPVVCDTHAEDDDWAELRTLLRLLPEGTVGYGIPSGGGLAIRPAGVIAPLAKPVTRLRREANRIRELPPLRPAG